MSTRGFCELEHPADLALHVWGQDLSSLYRNAARGLTYLLRCTAAEKLPVPSPMRVSLRAADLETLMVDWLGEVLYLTERHGRCWSVRSIAVTEAPQLHATLSCRSRCQPQRTIKAVTYGGLRIVKTCDGYETNIVLDV